MSFRIGNTYSRRQISDVLGGQLQDYLPTCDGRVVCGCFKPEKRWNPDAPGEVVFGSGPRVERAARLAVATDEPIPIFIFTKSSGSWKYVGDHRCMGVSFRRALCLEKERSNPDRGEIVGVLWFEPASEAA